MLTATNFVDAISNITSVTSSEHVVRPSDPNLVLTNPEFQKHLRLLHENAKLRGSLVSDDNFRERKQLLITNLKTYNRRSEIGAFKVKISESPDDVSYSGPIKFYYQAIGSTREICRVVSLSHNDCVRTVLPNLRQKFKIDDDVRCTLREMINGDEILLDPDDHPLELAVNSKYPATFHLVPGSDRNTELLRNLQSEHFTPEQRRKLIEKYNLRSEDERGSVTSSISTPRHRTSLSGSSAKGSEHQFLPKANSPLADPAMAQIEGHDNLRRKASMKETTVLSTSLAKPTRSNSMPKSERPQSMDQNCSHHAPSSTPPFNAQSTRGKNFPLPTTSQSTRVGRVRYVKHKKEGGAMNRRPSRSASARKLFRSLRKYRGRSSSKEREGSRPPSDTDDDAASKAKSELSLDANLPGILKIFGDAVSPGANYKSVMATTNSTAKELVKIVLERYGFPRQDSNLHVLCEVVGKFKQESKEKSLKIKTKKKKKKSGLVKCSTADAEFKEEYVRPLGDQEKPLVLQSYWKPQDGLCRRFEVRRRSKVYRQTEEDHSTRGINFQARRLVLQKSKTTSNLHHMPSKHFSDSESENEKVTCFDKPQCHEDSASRDHESLNFKDDRDASQEEHQSHKSNTKAETTGESVIGSDKRASPDDRITQSVPKATTFPIKNYPPCPYLITLQGNEENLIHSLDKPEVLIGSDVTDIKLVAPDVASHHCVITMRLEVVGSEKNNYEAIKRWCVTISPLHIASEVRINGGRISSKHTLQHGEMVSVGMHHLFMYKDPSCHLNLSNLVNLSYLTSTKDSDNCSTEAHGSSASLSPIASPHNIVNSKRQERIETLINYEVEQQDQILHEIFKITCNFDDAKQQPAVANLLCHCVLHSCFNFKLQSKNELLLKIASALQTLVLNATKNVSVNEVKIFPDPVEPGRALLTSLQPVVFWMSNSLKVFGFLQHDIQKILSDKVKEEKEKNVVDPILVHSIEDFVVNEEILALLEEVAMYAFQQLVYYLTKTLYGCLPAILESNPFVDDASHALKVTQITDVFTQARQLLETYDVTPGISEQLFAYLFFFTNVSLFNTLMEEGSSKYYKWEMGIRIRGNLEFIESWAEENGLMGQCGKHLEKITTLANLLATPRSQILKGSWDSFRLNFSALTPAQLRRILSNYRMPGNQSKPSSWKPPTDEGLPASCDADSTLESYDNHPPLMLPVSGSRINLQHLPDHSHLSAFYKRIQQIGACISDPHLISAGMDTSRREQGDGRELSNSEGVTSLKQDAHSITSSINDVEIYLKNSALSEFSSKETLLIDKKTNEVVEPTSSCSLSSEPEAYAAEKVQSAISSHAVTKTSEFINDLVELEREECDELVVLPIAETTSLLSHVSQNRGSLISPSSGSSKSSQGDRMPKEVFIVDIKRGRTGLGVGLIDGLATSLVNAGVYVRSLIPDNPSTKHSPTKHHDVIRCWLQEGRLQLGDRILAANGVSLINMSYFEAIKTVRQAGDNVRLLVGRCGTDVAMKITSSSC